MKEKTRQMYSFLAIILALLLAIGTIPYFAVKSMAEDAVLNVSVNEFYAQGTAFEIPQATITVGEDTAPATGTLIAPDGVKTSETTVLEHIGYYTLEYKATVSGQERVCTRDFYVSQSNFSVTEGGSVEFGTYPYDSEITEANRIGDGVIASIPKGGELVYNEVLDLSVNSFINKNETSVGYYNTPFFGMYFIPSEFGTEDFTVVNIRLTDIHDDANYVIIQLKFTEKATYVKAGSAEQKLTGKEANGTYWVDDGGAGSRYGRYIGAKFDGNEGGSKENMKLFAGIRFFFDSMNKALYAQNFGVEGNPPQYVIDLDSSTDFNANKNNGAPWAGFTDGRVRMSISLDGYAENAETGKIMIKELGAKNLQSEKFVFSGEGASAQYTAYPYAEAANMIGMGAMLTLPEGTKATYDKEIDITKATNYVFEGLNVGVPVASLYIAPETFGAQDIGSLSIRFTDVANEENYLTVNATVTDGATYFKAAGDGQRLTGKDNNTYRVEGQPGGEYGTFINSCFDGQNGDSSIDLLYAFAGLNIYYDYATKCVYGYHGEPWAPTLIVDLDDPAAFNQTNQNGEPWAGFESGKVKVSIWANEYTDETPARIFVKSFEQSTVKEVYGMASGIKDTQAPVISTEPETAPDGVYKTEYTIPTLTAEDAINGEVAVTAEVYFDYDGTKEIVAVENGKFLPEKTGVYTIVYTARDYSGNEAVRKLNVNIGKKEVTISEVAATARAYDKTQEVELSGGKLNGVVSGDDVSFVLGKGTMADPNVGENKAVTTQITLAGEDAANYVLVQPSDIVVNITKAQISVEAPVYTGSEFKVGDEMPALSGATTGGTYRWVAGQTLTEGTKEYNWEFIADDTQNYEVVNGTGKLSITVKASETPSEKPSEPEKDSGCKSVLGSSAAVVSLSLLGAAVVGISGKKRKK